MNKTFTPAISPTLAVILAGGLAAGIALARPSLRSPNPSAASAAETAQPSSDYRSPGRSQAHADVSAQPASVAISDFDFGGTTTVGAGQLAVPGQ